MLGKRKFVHIVLLLVVLDLTLICGATTNGTDSTWSTVDNNATESSGVVGPQDPIQRRLSKEMFKSLNLTSSSNSTEDNNIHHKRSTGKVEILESGSRLRTRGDPRVLKRGPGGPPARFSDSFDLRNTVRGHAGYDRPSSFETSAGASFISIPGSNIPPPIYSYNNENIGPPAPPPSAGGGLPFLKPTIINYRPKPGTGGGGGGNGGGSGGGGGGIQTSTTPQPEVILPPVTSGPGPTPIRPPTGTSVPIIGGGGGGGSVLPPSPPPEEIFPPAPPPEDEQFDEDEGVGRRLKIPSGRSSGGNGGIVRTRTRLVAAPPARELPHSHSHSHSRFTSSEASSLSAFERLRGGHVRRERLRDRVKEFKPLGDIEPLSDEIHVDDPDVITDFVFSDIKCYKTRQSEYFGATIHLKSGFHLPYIRDRPQDPLTSEECRLDLVEGTRGSYHMSVTDLRGCGVEHCGEAMCLTMVFPRVPMLALADDEVTTIKCTPQKSTMSDTKSISFAGDSMENRRSSSTVEGGIQEFVAEVGVFRQNPGSSNGLFVKRVSSGGVVQLGEPLQLRSVVRGTDGWKHSRLTDVKVWRMRDNLSPKLDNLNPNDASEVITLVDARGCRNDEYLVIADDHPIKDPRNDMVHHFTFKAFLFRGQRVNEPLIVTARVHACQEAQDCIMECEVRGRRRRSPVELHNASAIVHDYDSQLALRVVGLKDHPSSILDDEFPFDYPPITQSFLNRTGLDTGAMTCNEKMFATGLGGGCVMLLICGLAMALFTYIKQGRMQRNEKSNSSSSNSAPSHYRFPPPGRQVNLPYQKPLPPPPTTSSMPPPSIHSSHVQSSQSREPSSNTGGDTSISQVEKLLKELVKNNNNCDNKSANGGKSSKSKNSVSSKHKEASSDYACIDETNSSSAASSSEDLRKSKRAKDGVYVLYCYDKDKKHKSKHPMSAPLRRKQMKQIGRMPEDDDDFYDDDDFIQDRDDDSETMGSQPEVTDESDEYGELGNNNRRSNGSSNNNMGQNAPCNIVMNPGIRRTVREVKKKSKQNNVLAYASTRCRGNIRRRISSVYREGYLNGIRGIVQTANSKDGNPLQRYKKSPSTGNIPEAVSDGRDEGGYHNQASGKRIHFSVRERRSERKRQQHHQQKHLREPIYSNSEATLSDLDSAYSGSNCSKLTEVYEMKRSGEGTKNGSGPYPDFQKLQQNRMNVQRQLMGSGAAQGQNSRDKPEVRRTVSTPSNGENTSAVAIGLGSPPLSLGETKATHFVTRDDSTTKILIVPETHV